MAARRSQQNSAMMVQERASPSASTAEDEVVCEHLGGDA